MDRGISRIRIVNVKGYSDYTLNIEMTPNKPHVFVAPNGFGKSSFALAFNSMNSNRIDLDEKNTHRNNPENKPCIELDYVNGTSLYQLSATDRSNTITDEFGIFVINSQLVAHATKQNHGRYTSVSTSMRISPIVLVKTIPRRSRFAYSITSAQQAFGNNGSRIIKNISTLLNDKSKMLFLDEHINWHQLSLQTTKRVSDALYAKAREMQGTEQDILSNIEHDLSSGHVDDICNEAIELIQQTQLGEYSRAQAFFILWQLVWLRDNDTNYRNVIKHYSYLEEKDQYCRTIHDFNSSWNEIRPVEEKGSLVVNFPDADFLSNGQRDLLCFVLLLKKAEQTYRNKDKCILIVDEIFDYLDDANLVAFQHYISQLIQKFKENGRDLYSVLLTHLDPMLFTHFRLNSLKVHYLDERIFNDDLHFLKLIQERTNGQIKDFVEQYLFHYNPANSEFEDKFRDLGIRKVFSSTKTFHPLVIAEVKKYLEAQPANPFAVCTAIRIRVEENIYNRLATCELKSAFIETHKTREKLNFAQNNGVTDIPETYYLLSIIYDQTLHAKPDDAEVIGRQLLRNLTNLTIKRMIASLFPEF